MSLYYVIIFEEPPSPTPSPKLWGKPAAGGQSEELLHYMLLHYVMSYYIILQYSLLLYYIMI